MNDLEMENHKNKKKAQDKKDVQQTGSVAQYSNSTFFKKKDEEAKKFLKKHPVPNTFWD
ncbi:hypothetical protein [Parapedobacter sp. DT-150]|uniref:hypothetical protein n=1 Tax=Parapedobacter sp. DT-150 TaxID=3396162 RepID=UPI003F1CFF77